MILLQTFFHTFRRKSHNWAQTGQLANQHRCRRCRLCLCVHHMTATLAILSALQKPKSEPEKDSINEDMETEVELSSESVDEEDMERL